MKREDRNLCDVCKYEQTDCPCDNVVFGCDVKSCPTSDNVVECDGFEIEGYEIIKKKNCDNCNGSEMTCSLFGSNPNNCPDWESDEVEELQTSLPS